MPARLSGKRGESNFVLAFGRAYVASVVGKTDPAAFRPARELEVGGYGVADFVWLSWHSNSEEGAGVGMHQPPPPAKETLLAFEMKLRDWRKALAQACRYRYFADAAHVVLPPEIAERARLFLDTFRKLEIGLWSFDKQTGRIRSFYTPRRKTPRNGAARQRAVAKLRRGFKARPTP